MEPDLDARIERDASAPEVRVSEEELVLLDIAGGIYYTLAGPVSIRIWQSILTPCTLEDLVDRLVAEFDVERPACVNQTWAFLNHLASRGLVRLVRDA